MYRILDDSNTFITENATEFELKSIETRLALF